MSLLSDQQSDRVDPPCIPNGEEIHHWHWREMFIAELEGTCITFTVQAKREILKYCSLYACIQ